MKPRDQREVINAAMELTFLRGTIHFLRNFSPEIRDATDAVKFKAVLFSRGQYIKQPHPMTVNNETIVVRRKHGAGPAGEVNIAVCGDAAPSAFVWLYITTFQWSLTRPFSGSQNQRSGNQFT